MDYYLDTLKRQAVVNSRHQVLCCKIRWAAGYETTEFLYQNGIVDYVTELAGENPLTSVQCPRRASDAAATGRTRPEYKVKLSVRVLLLLRRCRSIEYYHNSSWLEHGGAPDKAVRSAFVSAIDAYLKQNGKYHKSESKITYQDIADCLVLVTNCFSTQTSYENQTKKAITNKFIQEAMTEFLQRPAGGLLHREQARGRQDRRAGADQQAQPRDGAKRRACNIKKKLSGNH